MHSDYLATSISEVSLIRSENVYVIESDQANHYVCICTYHLDQNYDDGQHLQLLQ